MVDVKAQNTRSRSSLKAPKSVTVIKASTKPDKKRSRSRGALNATAIPTVGLGKTLRRSSQTGSKQSLTRSTSTIKRSDSVLKKSQKPGTPLTSTQLVVWGCNMSNQLGIKSQRPYITMPKKCSWNISIAQIACGLDHCALVTLNGHLYTFGSN